MHSANGEWLRRAVEERLHAMTPEQRLDEAFRLHLQAISLMRAGQVFLQQRRNVHP